MPKVTYIEHDGTRHAVEVDAGISVMEGAIRNNVLGIEAECGGSCMCATCHVYVEELFLQRIPAVDEMEQDMLAFTASERRWNSRLSCQIEVTDALDGLVVHLPETQT